MFRMTETRWRRRAQRPRSQRARLEVEPLESRDVPSTFTLTPIVQVSGPSPFLGNPVEANDPPGATNLETEPYVAVDPSNSNHLVGAWMQDLFRGIVAAVSFNGGNTWQSVVIPGISLASGGIWPQVVDPWVSIATNGDVYVSSLGKDSSGEPKAVLVNKSTDGGRTWSAPITVVQEHSHEADKPSITTDLTNPQFVYAAWTRFRTGTGIPMFSRSSDGGQTWEPARELFNPGGNNIAEWFQIVVLPDGTLVNVFTEQIQENAAQGGSFHYDLH